MEIHHWYEILTLWFNLINMMKINYFDKNKLCWKEIFWLKFFVMKINLWDKNFYYDENHLWDNHHFYSDHYDETLWNLFTTYFTYVYNLFELNVNHFISNWEQLYSKPVLCKVSQSTTNVYLQCDISIEKKIDQSESVKFFEDRQTLPTDLSSGSETWHTVM